MLSRNCSLPPATVRVIDESPLNNEPEHFISTSTYDSSIPIAIDFGTCSVKAGYVNKADPAFNFPTRLTRFRDRKMSRTMTFIGNDTNLDYAVRSQSKTPFDGPFVTNWEYAEDILEYTFKHLGVTANHGISNPLIMTEKLATLQSQRANWYQLLFETFNTSNVSFGIDNVFAFYANTDKHSSGLVFGLNNQDTNVIPIIDGKPVLTDTKRINWGGSQSVGYLSDLMTLKYPYFPTKLTEFQYETLYKDYCYVSPDYAKELEDILSLEQLEKKDIVVEAPFTEIMQPEKTEEELRIQAEKRKENGRRLQEQAKQKRIEKMVEKQEEWEYYSQLKEQFVDQSKKQIQSILENAGFDDERDFKKYLYNLEKSLKRAQAAELSESLEGDEEEEEEDENANKFELLEVPDDQLDEEQIKEKRKQRLMKANYDARQRAKEEKLKAKQEAEELRIKEEQWRATDLSGWIRSKRKALDELLQKRKEKIKTREDMKDRKSQASQNRMKSLATLAEDNLKTGTKRTRQQATIDNDPNDTFGADDEDWMVYNDIFQNTETLDELIEEDYRDIVEIEKELLEFDSNFTMEDTVDAQYDWRNSTLHLFLRGPRPFDSENSHEQHQMHMNIERPRVPEILFQPRMGGCDQAGIIELSETMLLKKFGSKPSKLSDQAEAMAKNVWITGGHAQLPGLKTRIVKEFTSFLPNDAKFSVNISKHPSLDAWKGMAKFSSDDADFKSSLISKKEYEEYGPEYIKEHRLGNTGYYE
ncbi:hypothetical protein TPHA_0C03160 [Tetrapisispora phaffii CBS 4417]|uniref:Actin-related protein 5 n=1 Tax=Tetrapisispora phaffii (strain ATCC 24235 / CBS 4417 / NBRC 1672 / NRRL Y-8282 / UCD 70-5) TaxID=1071381 RepID=G8BRU3_TETPH|nr:hypothetical protein TPHA_0C03160 [Tetrapisispora phaffii CBS 4417]CCE62469.1 hypothetical protein TPHA_0C03160 [Tetrapisispora phaffii CBS 4417]